MCPAGWASSTVDATECTMCKPGYYAEDPKSPACLPCPEGTYSSSWGSSQCSHCITGTYSASKVDNLDSYVCVPLHGQQKSACSLCVEAVHNTSPTICLQCLQSALNNQSGNCCRARSCVACVERIQLIWRTAAPPAQWLSLLDPAPATAMLSLSPLE